MKPGNTTELNMKVKQLDSRAIQESLFELYCDMSILYLANSCIADQPQHLKNNLFAALYSMPDMCQPYTRPSFHQLH